MGYILYREGNLEGSAVPDLAERSFLNDNKAAFDRLMDIEELKQYTKFNERTTEQDLLEKAGKTVKFNPLDNPKIEKDIITDSNAVYGYRPKPGLSLDQFDIDWGDANKAAEARTIRLKY